MTPERWQQVSPIYNGALALESGVRAAFLREACGGDEALRRDVESLLARNEADDAFRDQPVRAAPDPAADTAASVVTSRRLGAYEIKGLLGAGGMGEVYRACDTRLGRDVALKILPRAFTSDSNRFARFEREARLLAALNHPHIGAIYGIEEAHSSGAGPTGVQALVLELVEGQTPLSNG